ncbi:hypothetical protein, partial [Klebsiella pneumoniae]|uniref:hypothetical protein n=1 Tax=Klebsiella pneumoniae TaxID=573 RepID=UPI0030136EF9
GLLAKLRPHPPPADPRGGPPLTSQWWGGDMQEMGSGNLKNLFKRIEEKLEENRKMKYSRRWVRVQEVTCPREV